MKHLGLALILTFAACSPVIEAHDASDERAAAILEEPAMPANVVACPADEVTSDDGIGGTGCR